MQINKILNRKRTFAEIMLIFLKLIRAKYLLAIVILQCAFRYFVLKPILSIFGNELVLSEWHFMLLVVSTTLLAAAGYIINDYFDIKLDRIKKPNELYISRFYGRRLAILLHLSFTFVGLSFCTYVALVNDIGLAFGFQFFVAGLLWFYSTDYKPTFILGPVILALFGVSILLIVPMYEPGIGLSNNSSVTFIIYLITGCYMFYFFLLSLVKSFITELQNYATDITLDLRTLPMKVGITTSKYVIGSLIVILMVFLGYIAYLQINEGNIKPALYLIISIIAPMIYILYFLFFSQNKFRYKYMLQLVDFNFVAGIGTMLIAITI